MALVNSPSAQTSAIFMLKMGEWGMDDEGIPHGSRGGDPLPLLMVAIDKTTGVSIASVVSKASIVPTQLGH
jgi:hypothetical protein